MPATVVRFRYMPGMHTLGPEPPVHPYPVLEYAYEVGGVEYQRCDPVSPRRVVRADTFKRRLDTLQGGEQITVRVDPTAPERATVEPGVSIGQVVRFAVGAGLLVVGLTIVLVSGLV